MKRLFIILTLVAVVSACDKEVLATEEGQDCVVTINTVGEIITSENELTKSAGSTNDMYIVQVYRDGNRFAAGIFDDVSMMKLNLKTGTKYSVRMCMIKDGKSYIGSCFSLTNNGIYCSDGYDVYAGFDYYLMTSRFFYNSNSYYYSYRYSDDTGYKQYSSSGFEFSRIRDGRILGYTYPKCTDWFYGEVNDYSPDGENATMNLSLIRTGFKIKYELDGVTDGDVTVRIYNSSKIFFDNTTNTRSYKSEEKFIAFYDTYSAWKYADNYTENMTVAVTWVRGIGVTQDLGTKTVKVKRNCLNNIRITLGSDDKGAGLSLMTEADNSMGNASSVIPVE